MTDSNAVDPSQMSKTGLFRLAKAKPVRPVTSKYLILLGTMTIVFALLIMVAGYSKNFVAAACASSTAILVMWISVAFLWHSVRQLNEKIEALTALTEKLRTDLEKLRMGEL